MLLLQVFDHQQPDIEFGCISAVFGPAGSGMEDHALVAVDLSKWHHNSKELYTCKARDSPCCFAGCTLLTSIWLRALTQASNLAFCVLLVAMGLRLTRTLRTWHAGAVRSGPRQSVVVYTTLTKQQLKVLRDADGGDEGRLVLLNGEMGVKLVSRSLDEQSQKLLKSFIDSKKDKAAAT